MVCKVPACDEIPADSRRHRQEMPRRKQKALHLGNTVPGHAYLIRSLGKCDRTVIDNRMIDRAVPGFGKNMPYRDRLGDIGQCRCHSHNEITPPTRNTEIIIGQTSQPNRDSFSSFPLALRSIEYPPKLSLIGRSSKQAESAPR